ncbi:nucleoside hydrolase [Legionella longbeachae]|uniref:Putative inosine-uridine preferring nucleoside hydrolase n=1 Tax=Legionella longbeachae serogroup 1 (strain NSW150) TaxID=661367 RepID=D3HKK8_LEGLN|nr:nucleoside hydrolase [Legionella longbeachae]VEE03491.1 inosine-uridine preferring nucleoside hydrolase [Legionella oakridgensis]HBD7397768.1 nucleoside hydrolase [Legionella pneumophila]ARB93617.1 nucleoside hydrolase [Legionella longbeachae]ARM33242.1 nucleoside hydrolase [Legionella longbeachae]EEZ93898.1 pyrimidine-specific ribonucleoside hydrolase RihB [Legionella longbeachae D-4968]
MSFGVKLFLLICFSLLFSMTHATRSFIIDTDVGTDDELALLYLLRQKDIDIKAITVVGTGESHCPDGLKNVAGLLALMHQEKIPLACGRSTPLAGNHHFPDWLRKQADNLAGAADLLPKVEVKTSQTAVQLLESTLRGAKEPVEILAVGPLTNLGALVDKAPELINKIKMIYIMGGAVESTGNLVEVDQTIKNTTAEWNIYVDPKAADHVFRSGVPITMVGLDVTNQVPVTQAFYQKLKQNQNSLANQFFYELFHRNEAEIIDHKWYFWDVLSAVVAYDDSIVQASNKKLRVLLSPEEQSGTTVEDKKGNNVRVCTSVDKERLESILINTLKASS